VVVGDNDVMGAAVADAITSTGGQARFVFHDVTVSYRGTRRKLFHA